MNYPSSNFIMTLLYFPDAKFFDVPSLLFVSHSSSVGHSMGGGWVLDTDWLTLWSGLHLYHYASVGAILALLASKQFPILLKENTAPKIRAILFGPPRAGRMVFITLSINLNRALLCLGGPDLTLPLSKLVIRTIISTFDPVPQVLTEIQTRTKELYRQSVKPWSASDTM